MSPKPITENTLFYGDNMDDELLPEYDLHELLKDGVRGKYAARLAEQELRRRLARYQLSDRLFREKYGMTLEEFEAAEVVKARDYSFEVENDHQDWDLAVDGIRTVERQLAESNPNPAA